MLTNPAELPPIAALGYALAYLERHKPEPRRAKKTTGECLGGLAEINGPKNMLVFYKSCGMVENTRIFLSGHDMAGFFAKLKKALKKARTA